MLLTILWCCTTARSPFLSLAAVARDSFAEDLGHLYAAAVEAVYSGSAPPMRKCACVCVAVQALPRVTFVHLCSYICDVAAPCVCLLYLCHKCALHGSNPCWVLLVWVRERVCGAASVLCGVCAKVKVCSVVLFPEFVSCKATKRNAIQASNSPNT